MIGRPLSELSQLDWASLTHAYGSAEDVPAQLEAIAAGDEEAYQDAFGNLWHQWTTFSATLYATPFLLGILEEGQSGQDILSLLAVISGGDGDQQKEIGEELHLGLPLYLAHLQDDNHDVVSSAARLCSDVLRRAPRLPERDFEVLWAMQEALLAQPVPDTQAALLYYLGRTGLPLPVEAKAFALAQLEKEDVLLLSISAALALAYNMGKDAPAEVTKVLLNAIEKDETEELGEALFLDPYNIFDAIAKAGKALGQVDTFAAAFKKQAEETGDNHWLDYLEYLEAKV